MRSISSSVFLAAGVAVSSIPSAFALLAANNGARRSPALTTAAIAGTIKCSRLNGLTERQRQFWEDVDDGLDDIEAFWVKKGQDIDRVRRFKRSATGEILPPIGDVAGHEPSEEHIESLTAKPFWDAAKEPALFPWAQELEEKASIILDEFEESLRRTEAFASDSVWQNQVMGEGWSAIRLQRLGVWSTENCKKFPNTFELLRSLSIPLAVRGVCFARQAAGSGVQPHSDGRNFILTSHLGLKVPESCWIQVGDQRRGWEEGKLTTLDTSFSHSTGNPSDSDRHVLIIDFWHPELTEAERAALEFVYDLRNSFESGAVPFRKPRSLQEEEEGGLAAFFSNLTGGRK